MTAALIGLVAVAAVVGFVTWYLSEPQVDLRAIREVERVRVSEAKHGRIVRIVGTLRTRGKVLRAPLSGRECAHFDLQIEELVSDDEAASWEQVFREVESSPVFEIEDSTGRALVRTKAFRATVVLDHHCKSGTFDAATPELEALIARVKVKSTGLLGFKKTLRYVEGALEPGEQVAVVGRARWEPDPSPDAGLPSERDGYRTSARRQRLVIEAHADVVRASDDPATLD